MINHGYVNSIIGMHKSVMDACNLIPIIYDDYGCSNYGNPLLNYGYP